jgi:competence protein ComEA
VGPSTAAAIIDHRERNGPFTSVEQLLDVRGIGPAKLDQLRELVTV